MARKKKTKVQTKSAKLLTFMLGKEEFALPIGEVHQIVRDLPVTRVPNVSQHVEGVINLRGVILPLVDLKHRLGIGVRVLGISHRLLIVESGSRLVGFSVDSVQGVIAIDQDKILATPDVVQARIAKRFIRGVILHKEGLVILLDLREALGMREEKRSAPAVVAQG